MTDIIGWSVVGVIAIVLMMVAEIDRRRCNKDIGNAGESIVAKKLGELGDEYEVKHDVHLGKAQIDHLVIHRELGICFVIETKMWGGIITGDKNDRYWLQDKGGVVKYLDNPIKQNAYHCNIVRSYYRGYKIYNVVVFVKNMDVPKYRNVVSVSGLVDYITGVSKKVSNKCIIDIETDKLSRVL